MNIISVSGWKKNLLRQSLFLPVRRNFFPVVCATLFFIGDRAVSRSRFRSPGLRISERRQARLMLCDECPRWTRLFSFPPSLPSVRPLQCASLSCSLPLAFISRFFSTPIRPLPLFNRLSLSARHAREIKRSRHCYRLPAWLLIPSDIFKPITRNL